MKNDFLKLILLLMGLGIVLGSPAQAQNSELIEKTFTGTSNEKVPQAAKRDILDQASKKVSEELIKALIGEDRFLKNKTLIQNKVERLSNRYIPFSRPGELSNDGGQFKMTVVIKVSLKDLKALLLENSLLAENDTAPVVLPLIGFTDKVTLKTFRWWKPEDVQNKSFLMSQNRHFENGLRTAFEKYNFYLIKPTALGPQVPNSLQNERLSLDDMQLLNQYFGAPLMIEGTVQFSKSPEASNRFRIEVKMLALQVSNGRPIADVSRRFESEAGIFEATVDKKVREVVDATAQDLASQVFEAWQRGALGSTILRLTFHGRIPLNQQEAFKEKLRNQVAGIRNIRERLISADSMAYEVDTNLNAKDFAAKLNAMEIDGRKWISSASSDSEVTLQVQR
jgi:hypothetical protein